MIYSVFHVHYIIKNYNPIYYPSLSNVPLCRHFLRKYFLRVLPLSLDGHKRYNIFQMEIEQCNLFFHFHHKFLPLQGILFVLRPKHTSIKDTHLDYSLKLLLSYSHTFFCPGLSLAVVVKHLCRYGTKRRGRDSLVYPTIGLSHSLVRDKQLPSAHVAAYYN